jgi:hypothetical protein
MNVNIKPLWPWTNEKRTNKNGKEKRFVKEIGDSRRYSV